MSTEHDVFFVGYCIVLVRSLPVVHSAMQCGDEVRCCMAAQSHARGLAEHLTQWNVVISSIWGFSKIGDPNKVLYIVVSLL